MLEAISVLLELKGENPFKVRAYQTGARALETLESDLGAYIAAGELGEVKGIGKALAEKISTLYTTGKLAYYDDLKASIPPGLIEMLEIPGLGPKKIRKVCDALGIEDIDALAAGCRNGDVAALQGFGKKTAEKILAGIANREAYGKRHRWYDAFVIAQPILEGLRQLPEVALAEHAGSLRRCMETVGDLDFLVGSAHPQPIMNWFTQQPEVKEITAKGETKASIRLQDGLQADLRVVPEAQFYYALHHFTGSKDHNVKMRQRALERGLSLSEWGLGEKGAGGKMVDEVGRTIDSEAGLFALLGLAFIPPELREGSGEIAAAENDALPNLVEERDIRGVFHNHTHASDGHNSLREMTQAAQDLGFEYWGVADHSKASFQANGLDEERVLQQIAEVQALNEAGTFTPYVFAGVECDILKDGSLDLEDSVLQQLDYVVVSVHNAFSLDETAMTARIIKAIEHPATTMLGHLTGRLLLKREPYAVDVQKVIDAALANHVIIELNANPWRLDMDWRHWRKAAERGLMCSINPDAHDTAGFEFYKTGVHIARKGWLEKSHVFNTWSLDKVRAYLSDKTFAG